jgi:hypothetical protein
VGRARAGRAHLRDLIDLSELDGQRVAIIGGRQSAYELSDGLYLPGFAATQDFGPFFGFVKGTPAAAELVVRDVVARA